MIKANNIEIKPTIFPDGTSQIWQIDKSILESSNIEIEFTFENEAEIFQLLQLNTLLKHGRIPHPISLHMPFLPYGRQDKEIGNENTFALNTFAKIINGMRFEKVTTLDAHSKIANELFDNFEDLYPSHQIEYAVRTSNTNAIAYPDKGACDRYGIVSNLIVGNKVRNQLTGYIEEYKIEGDCKDKDILMIDDICDGGMTFRLMARELYKHGAKSVSLYVTHGIFSKGLKCLHGDGIQRIFTKDGEVFASNDTNFLIRNAEYIVGGGT